MKTYRCNECLEKLDPEYDYKGEVHFIHPVIESTYNPTTTRRTLDPTDHPEEIVHGLWDCRSVWYPKEGIYAED